MSKALHWCECGKLSKIYLLGYGRVSITNTFRKFDRAQTCWLAFKPNVTKRKRNGTGLTRKRQEQNDKKGMVHMYVPGYKK